ncbi:Cell division cycle protein 27-B-like protein [Morus notabilis]|uniref:Cell division cycle protein 27-B-like protein n=1 Tax=Morus notabilis TaxID=981085 RepID=W9R9C4_9ROSA|nr:Cell division cycle protein 27-B-like protein [Morus notabilis]
MEALLIDCVHHSLHDFMYRNAIFICERLCAEFPTEVPNGAAGHYLLGLIYRYTDRRKSAAHHFKEALSIDPLMWAAYEELCLLGAADEASTVFGEAAARCMQKQYLHHRSASQSLHVSNEDRNFASTRNFLSLEDASPRQLKHVQGNNIRDIPGNYYNNTVLGGPPAQSLTGGSSNLSFYNTPSPMATQFSGVAPPPLCRNIPQNGPNLSTVGADSLPKSTVNSTVQAPRRKVVDEGKLRKISSRLFIDSGTRRSTRLSGDAGPNTNVASTTVAGNGTSNSSKYLGGSKLSSMSLRSMTNRKGQAWANENIDEGVRNETFEDARLSRNATTYGPSPSGDGRSHEQEGATMPGGVIMNSSRIITGIAEILSLLGTLGEGYRLSCMYKCQDALDVYLKLPHKHYNTGWVLSQVGKAYFELVDYLEADRAFSLARRASPYSLEGMDISSTVLYHLKEDMKYVSLEDFENGIKSYQSALRVDGRHYNAWYGLGMIYLRQEKFEFSEHHFRMAFEINPRSSVIMSYVGTSLHTLKRNEEALMMMEKAIMADKKNPLPMYQKANILVNLESFDEALEVLEELKEYAPRESSVYALMGKIYKRRNMPEKAMLHYGLALDLKPSATDVATIKAAIEKLLVPDELDDSL